MGLSMEMSVGSLKFEDSSLESGCAAKGQQVKARGGTPGTTPRNILCALKGHKEQGAFVTVRPVGAMCHGLG
jgi:hypothetical protein